MIKTDIDKVHNWINNLFNDPLIKILLKNCHLSKIQLETILIDLLAENIIQKDLSYEEKAKLRQNDFKISRGAFNRSLKQSKVNIMKSVNTIILLGYLGIFNSSKLLPLIEISNKVDYFIKRYKDIWQKRETSENEVDEILLLKEELKDSLRYISL